MTQKLEDKLEAAIEPPEYYQDLILDRIKHFAQLPVQLASVLELMKDSDVELEEIVCVIKIDPGMTANILKLANSALYGRTGSVNSLHEAAMRLGLKTLFDLMMLTGMSEGLGKALPGYQLERADLLKHSVFVAIASEELCVEIGLKAKELYFTAGLLHDVGKIILDEFVQSTQGEILEVIGERGLSFQDAEKEVLGLHHAEAGASLLERWSFPKELILSTRWHHQPYEVKEHQDLINIVHLAEILAYAEGVGSGVDGFKYKTCPDAIDQLGLKNKNIESVAARTLLRMHEFDSLLLV